VYWVCLFLRFFYWILELILQCGIVSFSFYSRFKTPCGIFASSIILVLLPCCDLICRLVEWLWINTDERRTTYRNKMKGWYQEQPTDGCFDCKVMHRTRKTFLTTFHSKRNIFNSELMIFVFSMQWMWDSQITKSLGRLSNRRSLMNKKGTIIK